MKSSEQAEKKWDIVNLKFPEEQEIHKPKGFWSNLLSAEVDTHIDSTSKINDLEFKIKIKVTRKASDVIQSHPNRGGIINFGIMTNSADGMVRDLLISQFKNIKTLFQKESGANYIFGYATVDYDKLDKEGFRATITTKNEVKTMDASNKERFKITLHLYTSKNKEPNTSNLKSLAELSGYSWMN